ncbi:MAG: YicC/YloC family endoribonuclease, partial [Stellaceae bacterium]
MSVASMTGFARSEGHADGLGWVWEIKSVNSKSLDLRFRLPAGYDALEPKLRAALAERVKRGAISVTLTVTKSASVAPLRVNRTALAEILALAKELAQETGAAPPRIEGLLALKGVLESGDE